MGIALMEFQSELVRSAIKAGKTRGVMAREREKMKMNNIFWESDTMRIGKEDDQTYIVYKCFTDAFDNKYWNQTGRVTRGDNSVAYEVIENVIASPEKLKLVLKPVEEDDRW
jgi:hypothetical protein